jgi:hypothetical protein
MDKKYLHKATGKITNEFLPPSDKFPSQALHLPFKARLVLWPSKWFNKNKYKWTYNRGHNHSTDSTQCIDKKYMLKG